MRTLLPALVLSVTFAAACSSDDSKPPASGNTGSGGANTSGGAQPAAGTPGTGGVPSASGGSLGSGAATSAGGSGAAPPSSGGSGTSSGGSNSGGKAGGAGQSSSGGASAGGANTGGVGPSAGGPSAGGSGGALPSGGTGGAVTSPGCTREALEAAAQALQEALEAADPAKMSLAAGATYEENMKASTFEDGIWKSAVVVAFRRSLLDVETCESFSEIIVTEGHQYVIGAQMKLADGKVAEVKNLVTDDDDWLFDADQYFKYSKAEDWSVIPEADRDTRQTLIEAGDAYFDLFSDKTVEVPWNTPCHRLEGGEAYTNGTCDVGVPDGIEFTDKHWIVDRDLGTAVGVVKFAGNLPDSHMFRSLAGKIRYVHTITVCYEPNCGL